MGAQTDNAFEVPQAGVLINETAGVYAGSGTPELVAPDAPIGSIFLTTGGTRYTRTEFTGSGVASDWAFEDPHATGGGASVTFSWRFSTTTTAADPGNKRLRFNDAVPANVTEIYLDDIDNSGVDVSNFLNLLVAGNKIYVQQSNNGGAFLLGTVVSSTDNTGWFTVVITVDDSGTLPANNADVGVLLLFAAGAGGGGVIVQDEGTPLPTVGSTLNFAGAGVTASGAGATKLITIPGGGTPGDQASVQARRTTGLAFTSAWVDVTLDATDFENDAAIVEHDAATDRLTLKEAGPYWITYRVDTDQAAPSGGNWQTEAEARVRVNDTGAAVNGSDSTEQALEDSSLVGDASVWPSLKAGFIFNAAANDFLTLQIQHTESDAGTNLRASPGRVVFTATRMSGETGPQGAPGSGGSTIRVGKTYAIAGEIKVPVGQTDFIVPFFVSLAGGQTADLVKARHQIQAGTSVTCKLQKNGVDVTGFTAISVTTTPADTDPTDVALAENDELALVVTAVAGTPQNMTFTIFIEHTG